MKSKNVQHLKVFFDTNILHTEAVGHLAQLEVAAFTGKHSHYPDLRVSWMLPKVVVDERRFQMIKAAERQLPALGRLEKLLGISIGIDPQSLPERVDAAIEKDRTRLGMQVISLDVGAVRWDELIGQAVNRRPPYAPDGEKGFRDSIALETFLQEVERSPRTARACVLVLVSADALLQAAALERTAALRNVRFCKDLDALGGLINTLISSVDEAYVSAIAPSAQKKFYDFGSRTGLYETAKLADRIREDFSATLDKLPEGVDKIAKTHYEIGSPQFVSKASNLLTWTTRVNVVQHLQRRRPVRWNPGTSITAPRGLFDVGALGSTNTLIVDPGGNIRLNTGGLLTGMGDPATSAITFNSPISSASTPISAFSNASDTVHLYSPEEFDDIGSRRIGFEVTWTCRVTATSRISSARVEKIELIGEAE